MRSRVLRIMPFGMAAALALSGCGKSEAEDSGAHLTGAPVKLMIIAPTETQTTNFPELPAAARAAARAINERGGIKGGRVEIVYCNDKNDPAAGEACARKAVEEKVAAVVGMSSPISSSKIQETLDTAGIPSIAASPIAKTAFTSPYAFNVDGGTTATYPACGDVLKLAGATKHAIVRYNSESTANVLPLIEKGTKGAGLEQTGVDIRISSTATDYSAFARMVKDSGADGISMLLPENQAAQMIKTLWDQGVKVKICAADNLVSEKTLAGLGEAASGVVGVGFVPLSSDHEDVVEFRAEMKAQEDGGDETAKADRLREGAYRAWVGPRIVERLAGSIEGEVTAESLVKALNAASDVDADMFGRIDFTEPGVVYPSIRSMTTYALGWDTERKTRVLLRDEPVDTTAYMKG